MASAAAGGGAGAAAGGASTGGAAPLVPPEPWVVGDVFSFGSHTLAADGSSSSTSSNVRHHPQVKGLRIRQLVAGPLGKAFAAVTSTGNSVWLNAPESVDVVEAVDNISRDLGVTNMSFGAAHGALITKDGTLFTWGAGDKGQLGLMHTEGAAVPTPVLHFQEAQTMARVSCGGAHTAIVTERGELYMCGSNREGQAGVAYSSSAAQAMRQQSLKVIAAPQYIQSLAKTVIKQVSTGNQFCLALTDRGSIWSWGEGGCGQLGIGRVSSRDKPAIVSRFGRHESPYVTVACGWAHSVAMTAESDVYVWGFNHKGQLGLGDTTSRFEPTLLAEQDLSKSRTHRRALAESRQLGSSSSMLLRQSGDAKRRVGGVPDSEPSPGQFLESTVKARGRMSAKPLEDLPRSVSTPLVSPAPTSTWQYSSSEFKAISIAAGAYHTAAVTPEGELYTWGSAEHGRLGHGDHTITVFNGDIESTLMMNVLYPERVTELSDRRILKVACSAEGTIAVAEHVVKKVAPVSGYTSGKTLLSLSGDGLDALCYQGFVRGKPGTPIPGVSVKFMRHEREPSVAMDDGEDEDAGSVDSEYLRELQELIITVPALHPEAGSDAHIQCFTPAFPSPCDVTVHIVVGGIVELPGGCAYSFYGIVQLFHQCTRRLITLTDPPKITKLHPELPGLGGGDPLVIDGDGLFGCMLADPVARDAAQQLMDEVRRQQLAALNAPPAKKGAKAGAKGSPAKAGAGAKPGAKDAGKAAAGAKGAKGAKAGAAGTATPKTSPRAEEAVSKLTVRLTLLADNRPASEPMLVPGVYEARYEPPTQPAVPDEDDDGAGSEGTFCASVRCTLPRFSLPPAVQKKLETSKVSLGIMAELAMNGRDYIPGKVIIAQASTVLSVTPVVGPAFGGTAIVASGFGILSDPAPSLRLRHPESGQIFPITTTFVSSTCLKAVMPAIALEPNWTGRTSLVWEFAVRDKFIEVPSKFEIYDGRLTGVTPSLSTMENALDVVMSAQPGFLIPNSTVPVRLLCNRSQQVVTGAVNEDGTTISYRLPAYPELVPAPAPAEGEAPAPVVLPDIANVSMMITLNGTEYQPDVLTVMLYDFSKLALLDANPGQVGAGEVVTLKCVGIAPVIGTRNILVRVTAAGEGDVKTQGVVEIPAAEMKLDDTVSPPANLVSFAMPALEEEEDPAAAAAAAKAKKPVKKKARFTTFELSVDGGVRFFGPREGVDVHVMMKAP